jgi:hypothetical protein
MTESNLLKQIQVAATNVNARLFRNNVALAWAGKIFRATNWLTVKIGPGDVLIREARPVHAGLCKGSSDLIGWTPVKITGEHVGHTLAVFTAVEAKTGRVQTTKEQQNFIDQVNSAGGFGVIARSVDDIIGVIKVGHDVKQN